MKVEDNQEFKIVLVLATGFVLESFSGAGQESYDKIIGLMKRIQDFFPCSKIKIRFKKTSKINNKP